jgi:hypothetical protein
MPKSYEILDLQTGELIESGFESYGLAARYFEENGYDYDYYGIVGVTEEEGEQEDDSGYGYMGWDEQI